jgi:hypothetical protein
VEGVQDGDRFGQLVADGVGVAAERVQRRGLDTGGGPGASVLEPISVGLPRPARNEVQQPGMNSTVGVTGVVHDPGDHAGPRRPSVGPDMLVNTKRVHPGQPLGDSDAPCGFCPAGVPRCMPRNAELMRQGRDRRIQTLQPIGCPSGGPGRELRPRSGQLVLLGERRSRTATVGASSDALGPQQLHWPAETRNIMEADLAADVPATTPQSEQPVRSSPVSTCKPVPVTVTALMWTPSTSSKASARMHQRPPEQDIGVIHVRVSLRIGLLGR